MLNLTPHAITIKTEQGEVTLPSNGVARVATTQKCVGETEVAGIVVPVYTTAYGEVEGVPAVGGEPFIVSAMVFARLGQEYAGQAFAPDTGKTAIRNEQGQIVAVTQLVGIE